MKINENTVKERIRVALNANGANPTNLAKRFGVNQKTLNNQINGDTSLSVSTILLIKEAIPDVSIEWLITGKGEMLDNNAQTADNKFAMELIEKKDAEIKSLERKIWEQEKEIEELKKASAIYTSILPDTTFTSPQQRK